MGWIYSFASAILAAIAGCLIAFRIGERCITWYRISSFEGGSGFASIYWALLGLAGSFLLGFAVAKSYGTGFLHGTGLALGSVVALMGVAYLLARLGGDVPPEIAGDSLQLMIEMRMAPDWKPSNLALAGQNACTLTSLSGGSRRRPKYGELDFKMATQQHGRWVVPCQIDMHSTRSPLLAGMQLGKKISLEFVSPLPSHLTLNHEQWTAWSSTGFAQPVGQAPVQGFAYRVRIKRNEVVRAEQHAANAALFEQHNRDFGALTDDSPLKRWLPYAATANNGRTATAAQLHLATHIAEFGPLLADADPLVVSDALEVLRKIEDIPPALHPAILAAGHKVLPLIAKAKLATDPEDPDHQTEKQAREFATRWRLAAEKIAAPLTRMKSEIAAAAAYAKEGDIAEITYAMR